VLQKVFDVRQTLLTADYAPWMTERLSTGAVHDGSGIRRRRPRVGF
jgi:hypothetical protein